MSTQKIDPCDGINDIFHGWNVVGLWPNPSNTFKYYLYGFIVQFTFTIIFNGSQLMNLFTMTNVQQSTQILFTSITELEMLVKIIITLWYRKETLKLMTVMREKLIYDERCDEEREKIAEGIRRGRTLYRILLVGYLLSAVTAAIGSAISKDITLPIPFWVPYDFKGNRLNYWITFTYVISSIIIHSPILSGIDTIPSCLMCVISGYYESIGVKLSKIGWKDGVTDEKTRIEFKKCIIRHIYVKEVIHMVQEIFAKTIFIQFCVGGFVICMTVFQMSLMPFTIYYHKYVFLVTYLIAMSASIFMPCFYGNELMLKNLLLLRKSYQSNWIDLPLSFKKDLVIFMQGTHYTNKIRAGGLFDASLGTFTSIANFTFSLYALLRNAQNK